MVLHIGNGYYIDEKKIIGIFDFENTTISETGREFLRKESKEGRLIDAADDIPKSYIVTLEGTYLASVNVATLRSRIKDNNLIHKK